MTLLVVDASTAAAWVLPSQSTVAAQTLKSRLEDFDLIAPDFLRIELRALLLRAERQGAARPQDTQRALDTIDALGIRYASGYDDDELDVIADLARRFGLSFYDALYLHVCVVENASLASRDGAMIAAAQARGVEVEDCR